MRQKLPQASMSEKQSSSPREVLRTVRGQETKDGAGVRLTRVIGSEVLPDLDPFLLFDEFGSDKPGDYIAGFPNHPHRGFETVTYMLQGCMRHRDNQGNSGVLTPGSVQWMTAGRGIVHSEMPEQEQGMMRGFQLWVNLPARAKMCAPRYQDISVECVPEVRGGESVVRVIAGEYQHQQGAIQGVITEPVYLDIHLASDEALEIALPYEHQGFIYVYEGQACIGQKERAVSRGELAVLSFGSLLNLRGIRNPARLVLVAAQPLREPVARYGPFVMNTREELLQAFADFNASKL